MVSVSLTIASLYYLFEKCGLACAEEKLDHTFITLLTFTLVSFVWTWSLISTPTESKKPDKHFKTVIKNLKKKRR